MAGIADMVARLIASGTPPDVAAVVVAEAFAAGVRSVFAENKDGSRRQALKPCWVYHLVDPRDEHPFYVGISSNPEYRFIQHRTDATSAAFDRISEIEDDGFQCCMKIVGSFDRRADALACEAEFIRTMPGLVNRARPQ